VEVVTLDLSQKLGDSSYLAEAETANSEEQIMSRAWLHTNPSHNKCLASRKPSRARSLTLPWEATIVLLSQPKKSDLSY
jgi:hypothetical protein